MFMIEDVLRQTFNSCCLEKPNDMMVRAPVGRCIEVKRIKHISSSIKRHQKPKADSVPSRLYNMNVCFT